MTTGSEKSIVIVDDSPLMRRQLHEFFTQNGFCVVGEGSDGFDALSLYQKHKPDLLTLDITMPNKNGLDTVKELITLYPEAKIVIITSVQGETILDCILYGVKGVINKPLRFRDSDFKNDFTNTILTALSS